MVPEFTEAAAPVTKGGVTQATRCLQVGLPEIWAVNGLRRHCDGQVTQCFLERLPQAVVLVDSRGAVRALNERATVIVAQGDGLTIHHGVLRCARPADTGALHRLIADVALRNGCGEGATGCGLRIHRPVGRRPLTALVTGLRCKNALRDGAAVIAVLANDPEYAPAIDVQMLRDWYDLTPAEARVAALLASGLSVDDIVDRLGIGANTARTHLKSIFGKTDTRRQGELIRLLLSNPTLGPGSAAVWNARSMVPTARASQDSSHTQPGARHGGSSIPSASHPNG
ncbi:MAG: helix-turn-helix transcriptional regulator [Candidatus Binatia bacterium]